MPFLPSLDELRLTSAQKPQKGVWGAAFTALKAWLDTLPALPLTWARRVLVVDSGGAGLVPASPDAPASFGGGTVENYRNASLRETAASRVINAATSDLWPGGHISFDSATAQTCTIAGPDLVEGFTFTWTQAGTGAVTFVVTGAGANLRHPLGHAKSGGQWTAGGIRVDRNGGGVVDVVLFGFTAA